jgi:hypothetical protein
MSIMKLAPVLSPLTAGWGKIFENFGDENSNQMKCEIRAG